MSRLLLSTSIAGLCAGLAASASEPGVVHPLWPGRPPGETATLPPEADTTKPTDNLIAGRRVLRIGNVSTPTLEVFRPAKERDTGAAVIVCPGGGHHILAYDLEGTEVAEWLTSIGVTGIVLKYRVPARPGPVRWKAAVQDGQRAVSLVRSRAKEWGIDPARIGILGFSAGGETAALTALLFDERQYGPVDDVDQVSARPDFAVLVYPGFFVEQDGVTLKPHVKVSDKSPPAFFAHAADDRVTSDSSVQLFLALRRAKVPAELHVYASGGHGYGLRKTDEPVTGWPQQCEAWMRRRGLLRR